MTHDPTSPAPQSADQCASVLAQWMACAEPPLALPFDFFERHNRREALSVWLSPGGELSAKAQFLAQHPSWSAADWRRGGARLWETWNTLDLMIGAAHIQTHLAEAFRRSAQTLRAPAEELMFWQAGVQAVDGELLFWVEGAFPRAAFERAVLRSPFPDFMGEVSEHQRSEFFKNRFAAELNSANGATGLSRLRARWQSQQVQTNDATLQLALAQAAFPQAASAFFSGGALLPFDVSETGQDAAPAPAGKATLAQIETAAREDASRLAGFLGRALELEEPPAFIVSRVDQSTRGEQLHKQQAQWCVSTRRQGRLSAEHELRLLRGAVRSASIEGSAPENARARSAQRL